MRGQDQLTLIDQSPTSPHPKFQDDRSAPTQTPQAEQKDPSSKNLLLTDIIERFLESKRSSETVRAYRRELLGMVEHMESIIGEKLNFISFAKWNKETMGDMICSFIGGFRKNDLITKRCTNARSLNRRKYALSSFFQFLIQKHEYPWNPTSLVESLPVPHKSSTPSPDEQDLHRLLLFLHSYQQSGITNLRNTLFLLCLFLLALRCHEARMLKWSQVALDRGIMILTQKGGTQKVLPLPPMLVQLFRAYQVHYSAMFQHCTPTPPSSNAPFTTNDQPTTYHQPSPIQASISSKQESSTLTTQEVSSPPSQEIIALESSSSSHKHEQHHSPTPSPQPSDFIFQSQRVKKSSPISATMASKIVRDICKQVFPDKQFTPHSFRKAFIEQALSSNADLASITNATGHASVKMLSYYDTRDTLRHNAIHDVSQRFCSWEGMKES